METVLTRRYAPGTTRLQLFGRIKLWLDVWSERRTLERLDRRMLADIGIEESSARYEAARPMWDVPAARDGGLRYGLDR